jgi:hypothetical protein
VSNNSNDAHLITRREFTVESAMALLAGVAITVSGCDEESPSMMPSTDVSGTVSANHGHVATVEGARITAGNAVSLDIRGAADHPHTVQLSAADMQRIGARQQVTATSTTDAFHSHVVTFN